MTIVPLRHVSPPSGKKVKKETESDEEMEMTKRKRGKQREIGGKQGGKGKKRKEV